MEKILVVVSIVIVLLVFIFIQLIWIRRFRSLIDAKAERRVTQFELLSSRPANIVFLGDSITEAGLWHELFPGLDVVNRGIDGNTTTDVLERVDQVFKLKPKKLFLMIGINDLNKKSGTDTAILNYKKLFDLIDQNIPQSKIYVQSILPVNDVWTFIDNTDIPSLNKELKHQANKRSYTYIDLHLAFSDSTGKLKQALSNDGIHLLGAGYELWQSLIKEFLCKS